MVIAGDLLASAEKSTVPSWVVYAIFGVVGAFGAGLGVDIFRVRDATKWWLRWMAILVGGGVAGVIAWLVAYFVFDVDL